MSNDVKCMYGRPGSNCVWGSNPAASIFSRKLGLYSRIVYASAHKNPETVLGYLKEHNQRSRKAVWITVAGRSNALGGFVAANSVLPTIVCPPFSDKSDYLVNIHSSLQMPSDTPAMIVLDPANAALAAKRILQ